MKQIGVHNSNEYKFFHVHSSERLNGLDLVQLGYHQTPPSYEIMPIVRDHFIIHFIVQGSGQIHIRGRDEVFSAKAGDCFIIRPYEITSYVSDTKTPWEYYWLGFAGFDAGQIISKTGFSDGSVVIQTKYTDKIMETFDLIDDDYFVDCTDENINTMLHQSIMYRLLHYLLKDNENSKQPSKLASYNKRDHVRHVISMIEMSYSNHLLVEELANMLSVNRNYLSKIFKEEIGISIKQFLLQYRMNVAAAKIRRSEQSIKEIALEVGFEDPLYFSRYFKKQFGCSPSKYRLSEGV
ncbi:MAG: AraC family transcriptional regulator [Firmicutes bacterium]|nr:AraC family transcriptional regulator [Bacillota bacterium]